MSPGPDRYAGRTSRVQDRWPRAGGKLVGLGLSLSRFRPLRSRQCVGDVSTGRHSGAIAPRRAETSLDLALSSSRLRRSRVSSDARAIELECF